MRTRGLGLLALCVALALFGAACKSTTKSSGPAKLHVTQVLVRGSGLYIEGSYSYVRIERDGHRIREVRLTKRSATIRLDSGSYRLVSFQRPCDGNCGYLDPATDGCREGFDASAGELVEATVRLTPGRGCTIAFG